MNTVESVLTELRRILMDVQERGNKTPITDLAIIADLWTKGPRFIEALGLVIPATTLFEVHCPTHGHVGDRCPLVSNGEQTNHWCAREDDSGNACGLDCSTKKREP